jgi:hypothetical protein
MQPDGNHFNNFFGGNAAMDAGNAATVPFFAPPPPAF